MYSKRQAVLAVLVSYVGLLLASKSWAQQPAPTLEPQARPLKPNPTQADFDTFSWETFVALNWPALADGNPDRAKKIGTDLAAWRVWERFTDPVTIFRNPEWDKLNPEWGEEIKSNVGTKIFHFSSKKGTVVTGAPPEGFDDPAFDRQAATHFPLIDLNGNFVVNEIRINKWSRQSLSDADLLSVPSLKEWAANNPQPLTFEFQIRSANVKATWRVFPRDWETEHPDIVSRYLTKTATIYVSNAQSKDGVGFKIEHALVGLVGLHVAQKVPGHPRWIWSTFEHVDNVEVGPDPPESLKPTFNENNNAVRNPDNNLQPLLKATQKPPKPVGTNKHPYFWSKPVSPTGKFTPTATAYTRPAVQRCPNHAPIPAAVNKAWQKVLPAPFKFYRLVVTQWFDKQANKPRPLNKDGYPVARNTVLETYLRGNQALANQVPGKDTRDPQPNFKAKEKKNMSTLTALVRGVIQIDKFPAATQETTWSSCMVCHQLALYQFGSDQKKNVIKTDSSFLIKTFLPAYNPKKKKLDGSQK